MTVEDLGDRWNTPEDLEFQDCENNFNQASSRFTAMRLLQAVQAAESMAQAQLHVGRTAATELPGTAKGPLDSLCDRRVSPTVAGSEVRPGLFLICPVPAIHRHLACGFDGAFPILRKGPNNVFSLNVAKLPSRNVLELAFQVPWHSSRGLRQLYASA